VEEQILKCAWLAPHYLIEVSRPDRLDEIRVHVELRPDCCESDANQAGRELAKHIKDCIGVSVKVTLCPAGSMERSAGKAVRVRDLRPRA
jgi:phenylacetate-CoA ligase